MTQGTAGGDVINAVEVPVQDATSNAAAFRFVQSLAQDLSSGSFDLPSFPEVATRVRQVLADEDVQPEKVVRVVGAEPALAARVVHIANSVALNFSGKPITDLRTAITRMGFNMVRSAALAFALSQLKKSAALKGQEKVLEELWETSTSVAAMAYVVARRRAAINPDAALLAGLLHGVGKLYILTQAQQHQDLLADPMTYSVIVRDWHSSIAKGLLESWQMPEEIVSAVNDFEDFEREHEGTADLTDVLSIAYLLVAQRNQPQSIDLHLRTLGAAKRLQLGPDTHQQLLVESARELAAMQQALGR